MKIPANTARVWTSTFALILLAVSLATPAPAEDAPRYYGAIKLMGAFSDTDSIRSKGFTNTLAERNTSDEVAAAAAGIGYRWKNIPVHSEVEFGYRPRFDFDVRDPSPTVPTAGTGYEANVSTTTVLFKAAFDFRNDSDFTPYVGGLLGWARNTADTERNTGNGSVTKRENSTDNFAYGLQAGVIWNWSDRWGMDFGYQYIDLGSIETGTFSSGESVTADDYTSHDLLLSLFYRF